MLIRNSAVIAIVAIMDFGLGVIFQHVSNKVKTVFVIDIHGFSG